MLSWKKRKSCQVVEYNDLRVFDEVTGIIHSATLSFFGRIRNPFFSWTSFIELEIELRDLDNAAVRCKNHSNANIMLVSDVFELTWFCYLFLSLFWRKYFIFFQWLKKSGWPVRGKLPISLSLSAEGLGLARNLKIKNNLFTSPKKQSYQLTLPVLINEGCQFSEN